MISTDPETFSSTHQNGKDMRAVSYALGRISVEQLVEDSLRVFLFMNPQDILANPEG